MKKIKTLCIVAILFANYSSAQKLNCDKPNKVQSINQKVREKTYQYIKLVNKKEYNVSKDSILALAKTYIDLQTSFNALFKQMQIDKSNFATKNLICKRYSQELNDLIDNSLIDTKSHAKLKNLIDVKVKIPIINPYVKNNPVTPTSQV